MRRSYPHAAPKKLNLEQRALGERRPAVGNGGVRAFEERTPDPVRVMFENVRLELALGFQCQVEPSEEHVAHTHPSRPNRGVDRIPSTDSISEGPAVRTFTPRTAFRWGARIYELRRRVLRYHNLLNAQHAASRVIREIERELARTAPITTGPGEYL